MRLALAQMFSMAAEDLGGEIEVRESYSGRGMFGENTAAVVFEGGESDMLSLGAYVGANFKKLKERVAKEFGADVVGYLVEDLFADLSDMRFDSMGRSGRVAY